MLQAPRSLRCSGAFGMDCAGICAAASCTALALNPSWSAMLSAKQLDNDAGQELTLGASTGNANMEWRRACVSRASPSLGKQVRARGSINGKWHLSNFIRVPSRLLKAYVVKPGIIVEGVLLHLPFVLEAPLIDDNVLPVPTGQLPVCCCVQLDLTHCMIFRANDD